MVQKFTGILLIPSHKFPLWNGPSKIFGAFFCLPVSCSQSQHSNDCSRAAVGLLHSEAKSLEFNMKGQERHGPWLSPNQRYPKTQKPLGDVWLFRPWLPTSFGTCLLDSLQGIWRCSTWLIEGPQHLPLLRKLHAPNLSIVLQIPEFWIVF